jgi:ATP-binding cassette subfamily B protein
MSYNFQSFKNTSKLFLPHLKNRQNRIYLLITAFLIIADVAVANLLPYYSKFVIDGLSVGTHIQQRLAPAHALIFSVFMLGFFITSDKILSHVQDIFFFPVINHCVRDTTKQVLQELHSLPYQHFTQLNMAEVINSIRRVSQSARAFIKILCLLILPTSIKLIIFCSLMMKWGFFGYSLIFAIILSLFILYKGTQWYTYSRFEAWNFSDKVIMRAHDSLSNTKLVRFFFNHEMNDVKNLLNEEAKLWYKTNTRLHSVHIAIGVLLGIAITGILFAVTKSVMNASVSIGEFARLQAQLIAVFVPLKTFSVEFRMFAESLIDIQKVTTFFTISKLNTKDNSIKENKAKSAQKTSAPVQKISALRLSNINFSPCTTTSLFSNLSLTIYPGEKLLISGNSGSGKSTLLNLLAGLYKPDNGKVLYNENSHVPINLHYITQDLHLFNDTIRYNLCYGLSALTDEDLFSALEKVNLKTKVMGLPDKLNSSVGDMGQHLSNGEIQRIALARALLLKPQILILDETTHSLEVACERKILEAIYEIIPTVIIVSHRASTEYLVTRIVTLNNGQLNEVQPVKEAQVQPVEQALFIPA